MRVLLGLTYYRPHVSGLTIYVERLGHALAARGHEVTILTSQYERSLPREEVLDGLRIVRVPVVMRISKGVVMPTLGYWATRLVREHDVISLHLPQLDAAGIALRGRLFGKPTVLTYHCDLQLPAGRFNRVIDEGVFVANMAAGLLADRIVAYTQDYADHSRYLRRFRKKLVVIPPPVIMPAPDPAAVAAFRAAHGLEGRPVIGYAARFAAEKGIEYLVEAMPILLERFPTLKVVFVEGGFVWLPTFLWRLDADWRGLRDEVPWVKRPPSEYVLDHCRFTSQPIETADNPAQLRTVFEWAHADRVLMFASDYPHWDFDSPEQSLPPVSAEMRERIFSATARELYRLPAPAAANAEG